MVVTKYWVTGFSRDLNWWDRWPLSFDIIVVAVAGRSTNVACCCWAYYNWEPQEGAVNTNFDDNGDVFCKGVNPELLISLLTKNPCHIDNTFSLFSLLLLQLPWFACWTYYRSLLTIMSVKPMCGVLGK